MTLSYFTLGNQWHTQSALEAPNESRPFLRTLVRLPSTPSTCGWGRRLRGEIAVWSATGRLPHVQAIGETPRPTAGEAITKAFGLVAVVGATVFVIWQLRPDLLFSSAMDVGGDNAGHIVTPYFLIHDLLPQGRITGWDPQWFEGFPLYVFYFPLPALFVGGAECRVSLCSRLQAGHGARPRHPSSGRLGIRAAGGFQEPRYRL